MDKEPSQLISKKIWSQVDKGLGQVMEEDPSRAGEHLRGSASRAGGEIGIQTTLQERLIKRAGCRRGWGRPGRTAAPRTCRRFLRQQGVHLPWAQLSHSWASTLEKRELVLIQTPAWEGFNSLTRNCPKREATHVSFGR